MPAYVWNGNKCKTEYSLDIENFKKQLDLEAEAFKKGKPITLEYLIDLNLYLKITQDERSKKIKKSISKLEKILERKKLFKTQEVE